MKYNLIYKPSAIKDIKHIDTNDARNLREKINQLANDEPNLDVIHLKGYSGQTYRLRWGDYRVVYEKYEEKIIIIVIMVGHRNDVYKRLGRAR